MDKKRLYIGESVEVINELEIDIKNFVDSAIKNYGDEYDRATLELYIVDSIMTRFAYHRIKTMVANKEKKEEV